MREEAKMATRIGLAEQSAKSTTLKDEAAALSKAFAKLANLANLAK